VSLTHPDGVIALLSRARARSPRTSPRRRSISASARSGGAHDHDLERDHGRASTFTMLYAPSKFVDENPKAYAAVLRALQAAIDLINKDKKAAADVFLASEDGKGWKFDDLMEVLNDPDIRFTTSPESVLKYANSWPTSDRSSRSRRNGRTCSSGHTRHSGQLKRKQTRKDDDRSQSIAGVARLY
jgi:NitT/TauT family transport system substrate-binding protein